MDGSHESHEVSSDDHSHEVSSDHTVSYSDDLGEESYSGDLFGDLYPDEMGEDVSCGSLGSDEQDSQEEEVRMPHTLVEKAEFVASSAYLSFRSTDTSKMFGDHLCKALKSDGIPTIYYDSELGDEMSSLRTEAIKASKTIFVVLSENYASSEWCLDELVEIIGSNKQSVVPIFYHVDPVDVSHQTGEFGTAFQKLKGMNDKKLQTWKAALTEVGNLLFAYYLPLLPTRNIDRLEAFYISEIVKSVKPKVPLKFKSAPTIMQYVLHADWDSKNSDSDPRSQHSLFNDNDGCNWRKYGEKRIFGSDYLRKYYRCLHIKCPCKKHEESLDGQVTQIVYIGQQNHHPPQSSKHGKDTANTNETSSFQWNTELVLEDQIGKLDDEFSAYVKDQDFQPKASLFLGHKKKRARQIIETDMSSSNNNKLVKTRVHERNEDEHDAMRRMEVQLDFPGNDYTLFDITEFLGLMEKVLECKLPKSKSIVVRNLKVMHIRNSNLSDIPENLSFPDLENLFLQSIIYIPSSIFERMPALRILDMSCTGITTLPPTFTKLIKLEKLLLHGCQFLKELPHEISALVNLNFLDLSGCTNLAEIPESINFLKRLSIVVLKDCKSLTELPESICKLISLGYLSLSGCSNLAEIPESFALLESLSSLNLTDCKSLTKLPESISKLRSLKYLYLSGCTSLSEFHAPEVSIHTFSASGQADEMEVLLDFRKSEGTLLDITELLGLLEKVVQYEFLKSKSVAVRSLKVIHIRNSKLPEIPDNLRFPDLEELFLQPNLHMSYIPSSFFKQMLALKVLDMSNTSIKTLPPSVSDLFELEQLVLRYCELLMELPPEISALGNLKVLDLEGTNLVCLPDELRELTNLKCLKVSLYDAESYRKSKKIVDVVPAAILSKLTQLEELRINVDPQDVWCSAAMKTIMEDLPNLRKLKTIQLYLPTTELLKKLVELKRNNDDLSIYQNLSNFSVIIGPRAQHFISRLPCDLEEEFLKLKKCLKYINGEDNTTQFAEALKHANALYLDRHWTIQKLSIFNLEDLNKLKFCLLVDCNEMQTIFDGSDFNLRAAEKGENLLSLQYLAVHYLKSLVVIWNGPGVGCCSQSLKVLDLHMCPNLTTVFTPLLLGDLHNLEEITVDDCPKITSLIAEDPTQLTSKETLPRLKKLSLFYLPGLVSISSGLSIGPELEKVVIYDCPELKRLPSLGVCNKEAIEIKGEIEWWNALEWDEPEWSEGQPLYLHSAFSELNIDGDSLDELTPQYGHSLRLFAEVCDAN